MNKEISLENRKYNLISQITNFDNEKIIQKIEDFIYLIKLQKMYDENLNNKEDNNPDNLFIEHQFN